MPAPPRNDQGKPKQPDKSSRKSVAGSNISEMIDKAIDSIDKAEKAKCDRDKLLNYVRHGDLQCKTADDVLGELGDAKIAGVKTYVKEQGIGTEAFVDALKAVADTFD